MYLVLLGRSSRRSCICARRANSATRSDTLLRTVNAMPIEASSGGKRDSLSSPTPALIAPPMTPEIKLVLADEGRADLAEGGGGARRDGAAAAILGVRLGGRASARSISPPGRGWSQSPRPKPARPRSKPAISTPSPSPRLKPTRGERRFDRVPAGKPDYADEVAGRSCWRATSPTRRTSAERATDWLARLAHRGAIVLIGDPRRTYLPRPARMRHRIFRAGDTRTGRFGDKADRRLPLPLTRRA